MRYILKKVMMFALTLFFVSLLAFFAFEIIPGDAAVSMLGTEATSEALEVLREELGMNGSAMQRYGKWLGKALKGDLGISYNYRIPVSGMIAEKLPITLTLTAMSFVLVMGIAFVVSILSVRYTGTWIDKLIFVGNQITMSVPSFFVGIVCTIVFGLTLRIFVVGNYVSYTERVSGFVSYLFFPALSLAIPKSAMTVKMFRNALLEEMKQDYVRTAYSRGNSEIRVLLVHILKNALIPVVTFLGWAIADLMANSIIIEQVFGIPGMTRVLLAAISKRDYPVVEGIVLLFAVVVLSVNLIVDILYHQLDKRIVME